MLERGDGDDVFRRVVVVGVLVVCGACAGDSSITPLITAIDRGTPAEVKSVLDAGADPNRVGPGSMTPAIAAARRGDVEILRLLLERGADPRRNMSDRWTALMSAATGKAGPEIVAVLVDAGVDPCVRTTMSGFSGMRSSAIARSKGRGEIADALERAEQSCPP